MTATGCTGCRHDDHCGRQLDVSRSVGCVEYDAGACGESCSHPDCRAAVPKPAPTNQYARALDAIRVVGSALIPPGEAVMVSQTEDGVSAVRVTGTQPPHPLLALEQRLRVDAERAGHEAWRNGRGSYECGLRRGEALGLTRAADELAALCRGDHP